MGSAMTLRGDEIVLTRSSISPHAQKAAACTVTSGSSGATSTMMRLAVAVASSRPHDVHEDEARRTVPCRQPSVLDEGSGHLCTRFGFDELPYSICHDRDSGMLSTVPSRASEFNDQIRASWGSSGQEFVDL